MSLLGKLVYLPLQVLFIPLAIVGAVILAYKQLVVSKRLGVSQTAVEVINGRWTMHIFGMRPDQATAKLAAALPNTSLPGLWLALFPLWAKYKLSGRLILYLRRVESGSEKLGAALELDTQIALEEKVIVNHDRKLSTHPTCRRLPSERRHRPPAIRCGVFRT
jgi:hypothetical protein